MSQYWVQFALLEEHCHNYVEALNAYQRGLEHGAQPNGEVESNLYVFMMRMDERLERATRGECGPAGLKALQDFVALLRTKEPAPVAREETEEAAAKHNEAQKLEEAQIKEEAPVEIRNAQQIAALAALDLQQLMQASGQCERCIFRSHLTAAFKAAPAEVAARADAAATELERTGPRRSERLAGEGELDGRLGICSLVRVVRKGAQELCGPFDTPPVVVARRWGLAILNAGLIPKLVKK